MSVSLRSSALLALSLALALIAAGQTARIQAGQWLVEQPSDIHEAANRGSSPVVIYLATLLKNGSPPATPITLP